MGQLPGLAISMLIDGQLATTSFRYLKLMLKIENGYRMNVSHSPSHPECQGIPRTLRVVSPHNSRASHQH
jgi:hypothetical protein